MESTAFVSPAAVSVFATSLPSASFYGIYKLLVCTCIRQEYLYLHAGIRALDLRCHLNARSAVVVQIKMGLIYRNDIDVTVKSAVECEICILRIYSVVYAILHSDHNQVLFFCENSFVMSTRQVEYPPS